MIFWSLISYFVGSAYTLDAPKISNVWAVEPAGLFVKWDITFYESKTEVTGFKVSVWKVKMSSNEKFDLVNAEQYPGILRDDFPLEDYHLNSTLSSSPQVINVPGKTQESALIKDIEYNTIYEVRLQGVKGDQESPLSEPRRIKIVKGEGYHVILQKLPTGCLLSVPNYLKAIGETYPFVQNSFY